MLTLVHPRRGGQGGDPPKRRGTRSPALSLTDTEAMRLRAALRNLRALPMYGTWPKVAQALGVKPQLLHSIIGGRSHPSPVVALLVARAARSTVERILEAGPAAADRCPHCGAAKAVP